MRPAAPAKPHKRAGFWYLVRRVPKAVAHLDTRPYVRVSTEIRVADDPKAIRAAAMVRQLDRELQAYWEGLAAGQAGEVRARFDAAKLRAKRMGLTYATAQELADGPLEEILRHVQALVERGTVESAADTAAALGGEQKPELTLSGLFQAFEDLMEPSLEKHSPNQRRKWGQKYKRAVNALIELRGDKRLTALARADAIALRIHWQEKLKDEGLDIGTANKQMGHIATMLDQVELVHQLGIAPGLFAGISIRGAKKKSRKAFTAEFVQNTILAEGALDALNAQARAIVWVEANTGARPVEIANLLPEMIFLDAKIPFIRVKSVDRVLKTVQSERDIPLVGAALVAIKLFPTGFPRYHDNGDSLSALINKYLAEHGMRPEPGQSNYSFRHCFEDRLTKVEAPEKVIAALMGHKFTREKYGDGPSLEQKHGWLEKIAFTPPRQFGPL